MNGWILALIYFFIGLIGALGSGAVKKKSNLFLWTLLLGLLAFGCKYFEAKVSFAGTLSLIWGGMTMLCAGNFLMLLIRCCNTARSRQDQRARRRGAASGRLTREKRRKLAARTLFLVPLCLVFCTGGVMLYTSLGTSSGSGVLDNSISTPDTLRSKTMNILICGIDNDQADAAHQQNMTDVIMVASIDFENHKASLLQIPRDTYVGDVTATGKINAVYNNEDTPQESINALASQLYDMMKLPIDNYVTITMEGFRKAVDVLGGVEVNLEQEMVFNLRDPNEVIVNTITLPAGPNLLNGEMADLFVRYRDYARADLDRMNVQRIFLAALTDKLTNMSAGSLLSAVTTVYPYLETDFSLAELADLAMRAKEFSASDITAVRVPGEPVNDFGENHQSVFTLHKEELAQTLNAYMRPHADPVDAAELKVIELQNTTGILDHSEETLDGYIAA